MKAVAQEWLDFAKADLMSCENNSHNEFLTNIVAFHCQQAVEKCLKAVIEEKGLGLKRIHSLYKLYEIVKSDIPFDVSIDMLEMLDEIYTSSRYTGETGLLPSGKPSMEEARIMFEFARNLFDELSKILKP
jgi:HEPN domain-containing protein